MAATYKVTTTAIALTAASTAQQITTNTNSFIRALVGEAENGNTSNLYVGGAGVSMTNGLTLSAGSVINFDAPVGGGDSRIDMSTIYINASSTNNRFRFTYYELV